MLCNEIADVSELAITRATPQCQVHHADYKWGGVGLQLHQYGPPSAQSGKLVFVHPLGVNLAQHAVAVLGDPTHIAIDLAKPPGKIGAMREILRLVQETAPDAPGVHFLQANEIEWPDEASHAVEILVALPQRYEMFPARRDVVPIEVGSHAVLDIEAEQIQGLTIGTPGWIRLIWLFVVQHFESLPQH
jgi:hypothetical protein